MITEKGSYPIRVLTGLIEDAMSDVAAGWPEEAAEQFRKGLNSRICIDPMPGPITDVPMIGDDPISGKITIQLPENYLQLIWSVSYGLTHVYRQAIERPLIKGEKFQHLKTEDPTVKEAIRHLTAAQLLFQDGSPSLFFRLVNPEAFDESDREGIEIVNRVFAAAVCFVILHEYSHYFKGHFSHQKPGVKIEMEADAHAIAWYQKAVSSHIDARSTFQAGLVSWKLCLLLSHRGRLDGGEDHPHPDHRMLTALERIAVADYDPIWLMGLTALQLYTVLSKSKSRITHVTGNSYELIFRSHIGLIGTSSRLEP